MREHPEIAGMKSVSLDQAADFDAVVIATNHSTVDYQDLGNRAQLIIDTRGVMRGVKQRHAVIVSA